MLSTIFGSIAVVAIIAAIVARRKQSQAIRELALKQERMREFDRYVRLCAVSLENITVIELIVEEIEMVPVIDI